jgi:acyl-CoA thioester hydrolase
VHGVSPFVTSVGLRWTDQDAYRHVNHARVVTLLEEARIDLAFTAAGREGLSGLADGLLVARLEVEYVRQISYRPDPLRVAMTVRDVRAASFTLHYVLHDGPHAADPVAVRASTGMALYDLAAGNVRRMDADERAFLRRFSADEARESGESGGSDETEAAS